MRNAEKVGLITTKPETTCEELLNAFGDSLSDLASSDDGMMGRIGKMRMITRKILRGAS